MFLLRKKLVLLRLRGTQKTGTVDPRERSLMDIGTTQKY